MGKRLTDTDKWKNKFIRGLKTPYKLLWFYICDECNHAGIWMVDIEVALVKIGEVVTEHEAIEAFGSKVLVIDDGKKWFLPDFISFQYGDIFKRNGEKKESNILKPVIKELNKYGLIDGEGNIEGLKPLASPLQAPLKEVNNNINIDNTVSNTKVITNTINDVVIEPLASPLQAPMKEVKYSDVSLLKIEECLEVLMNDKWGKEKVGMMLHNRKLGQDTGKTVLRDWGDAFNRFLKSRLIPNKQLKDYSDHFNNWMNLTYDKNTDPKKLEYGKSNGKGANSGAAVAATNILQPGDDFWQSGK